MELQEINLTEQDFNLLIEGLEELPNKGAAGRLMSDLIGSLIAGNDPKTKAFVDKQISKQELDAEQRRVRIDEEVTLLKSKMILLKRYLITNGALKTTNKILGNE